MATLLSTSPSFLFLLRNPNPTFLHSSFKPSPLTSRLPSPPLCASPTPLFFAAIRHTASPLIVLASSIAKWLDLYGLVLMLRVLLSWFPNLPWRKQPLAAVREITDPYLGLFRKVIPTVGGLDLSPVLAFAVLGFLSKTITGAIV